MWRSERSEKFLQALRSFEGLVDEPVLPGETHPWCEAVRASMRSMYDTVQPNLEAHERCYKQIVDGKVYLASQVEHLRRVDARFCTDLESLDERIGRLLGKPQGVEDEPFHEAHAVREELFTWIVHARAHEREVNAWFAESIYREEGTGD